MEKQKLRMWLKNSLMKKGFDIKLKGFKIIKLGDGIEVEETNFAEEVAATASKN
jgi:translation elongation factor EF-Ts